MKVGLVAGATAGAAGLAAVGVAAKVGFDEFNEGQKVAAQTVAVIKSTGGVANVTAAQVDALGLSLMKKSGVDDEVVKSGENMLLTFRGIRNEAGAGNDIFNQATRATLDMSVAMGMDATKAALQLGKALNDPEKGMTRLQRVGVTFTDSQKEAVAAMVATGDTAGAQKVILAELTAEFGGSAEAAGSTFSGQMNVAKETLKNFAGELVGGAMPALTRLLTGFTDNLPAIEAFVGELVQKATPAVRGLSSFVSDTLIPTVRDQMLPVFRDRVLPILQDLGNIFTTTVRRIGAVVEEHRPELVTIWRNVADIVSEMWKIVGPILKVAFEDVLPRVLGVAITSIAGFTTVVRSIVNAVDYVATSIGPTLAKIGSMFGTVTGDVSKVISDIVGFWRNLPDRIAGAVSAGAGAARERLHSAMLSIFSVLPKFVRDALDIHSPSKEFENIGIAIMEGAIKGMEGLKDKLIAAAWSAFKDVTGMVKDEAIGIADAIGGAFGGGDVSFDALKQITAAVREANRIDAAHYPYVWGGGHNASFSGPYDCSGAVSAVLHKAGLLGSAQVSGELASWGTGGAGKAITVFADAVHTFMNILGRGWGTGTENDRGGAGWLSYNSPYRPGFATRHWPGLAEGAIVTSPTRALIGEAGPEAVIPLSPGKAARRDELLEQAGLGAQGTAGTLIDGMGLAAFRGYMGGWPSAWLNEASLAALDAPFKARVLHWLTGLKKGVDLLHDAWRIVGPAYFGRGGRPPRYFIEPNEPDFSESVSGADLGASGSSAVNPRSRLTNIGSVDLLRILGGADDSETALVHEWAHSFQKDFVLNRGVQLSAFATAEGGAEAFARTLAPRVFAGLGITNEYLPLSGKGKSGFGPGGGYRSEEYDLAAVKLAQWMGPGWIFDHQFVLPEGFRPPVYYFGDGALVKGGRGGVLAMVGEGRRDELVTPLPPGGGVGRGGDIHVNFYGDVFGDKRAVARELVGAIKTELRRDNSLSPLGLGS